MKEIITPQNILDNIYVDFIPKDNDVFEIHICGDYNFTAGNKNSTYTNTYYSEFDTGQNATITHKRTDLPTHETCRGITLNVDLSYALIITNVNSGTHLGSTISSAGEPTPPINWNVMLYCYKFTCTLFTSWDPLLEDDAWRAEL